MEKITITIEGTADEIISVLQKFGGVIQQHGVPLSWLPGEIEDFYDGLKTDAQRILRQIARSPEGYDRNILMEELKIESGRSLAGMLSSVGHNMSGYYPMKPKPIMLEGNKYVMLPEFAEWIGENTDQD